MNDQGIEVYPIPTVQYYREALDAYGTFGWRAAIDIMKGLWAQWVHNEILVIKATNYHTATINYRSNKIAGVPILSPRAALKGAPDGLHGDVDLGERLRGEWEPQEQDWWRQVERLVVKKGLGCGLYNHILSNLGGHMVMSRHSVPLSKDRFNTAVHTGFFPIPDDPQAQPLLKNLKKFQDYPDELQMPLFLFSNIDKTLANEVIAALFTNALSGDRYISIAGHSLIEELEHVKGQGACFGMSLGRAELPVVVLPILMRLKRWFWRLVYQMVWRPVVSDQQLAEKVSDAIVDALQDKSVILNGVKPNPDSYQFMAVGGHEIAYEGNRRARNWQEKALEFRAKVMGLVEMKLKAMGRRLPPAMSIIWSPAIDVTNYGFVKIRAVRVFPLEGKTARDFINPLL